MKTTSKTALLKEKDATRNSRFQGRITEAPITGFIINDSIVDILADGDTFELARFGPNAKIIGIRLENDFTDVIYSIGMSNRNKSNIADSITDNTVILDTIPIDCPNGSIYITIESGMVKRGNYIKGIVLYTGA